MQGRNFWLLIVLCLGWLTIRPVQAQEDDDYTSAVHMKNSEGTDFWVCFMKNYHETSDASSDQLTLQLFFTANETANVTVQIPGLNYKRTLIVNGNSVASLVIDEHAQLSSVAAPQKLAIHIQSDFPISVYGLNRRFQTTDTYLALPVSVLGKEYRAICYNKLNQDLISQVAIVATEDNTELTIIPRCQVLGGYAAEKPYTMKLSRGEAYQMVADFSAVGSGDLTGSYIKGSKPISVFSGHSCGYVPSGIQACNHLVEQLPPINAWGKHFYVGMLKGRSRYTLRVVAHEDRTKVFEDSRLVAVLSAGDFYENLNVRKHLQITADKPIMVAQYSQGFKNGDSIGDPMMILISPTQQFVDRYRIATPVNGYWDHFLNIVVPTEKISTLRLDGKPIPLSNFETLGLSRYSLAQIKVDFGTHVIHGAVPFGLYLYGFGYKDDGFDAYGNMGGQSFYDLDYSKDTLGPIGETQMLKSSTTLIIRDDRNNDRGIKSVSVVFAQGLTTTIPTIEEGAPQVILQLKTLADEFEGKMVVRATDVAGNVSTFTVCYQRDSRGPAYSYKLCPDGQDCEIISTWYVGAYIYANNTFHNADFSAAGNVVANGPFGAASGTGGYFGLLGSRRLNEKLALTGRLNIESVGGTIHAPDSVVIQRRDSTTGKLENFQEERTLSISAPVIAFSFVAEYNVVRSFYVLGGAKASLLTSSAVDYKRRILQPPNTVYKDVNSSERDMAISGMDALTTLRFAFIGGAGFSVPINSRLSAFLQAEFELPLNGFISTSNGSWSSSALSASLGLRYRL